jgi:hypothetical protein
MATTRLVIICGSLMLLAGCAKEPPPRTVAEFLDNRILLEATMVRCGKNRNMSKYEAECVNAREIDDEERRVELEAQSARKRKALRRTQQAAAEAKRRAADARRRREEEEYLGVFEGSPPGEGTGDDAGNVQRIEDSGNVEQAPADGSQPAGEGEQDLESIREELRRRQESD